LVGWGPIQPWLESIPAPPAALVIFLMLR